MITDKYQFKAFQMSLAVHALVFFIVIGAGSSLKPSNKLLVIDFRMENSTGTTKESTRATAYESRHRTEGINTKAWGYERSSKGTEEIKNQQEKKQRQETPILTTPEIHETSTSGKTARPY